MKTKEFFVRLCVILPMALWAVFLFLILFGIVSYFLGAGNAFYCTTYCKVGIAMFIIAAVVVTYCQAKACCRE